MAQERPELQGKIGMARSVLVLFDAEAQVKELFDVSDFSHISGVSFSDFCKRHAEKIGEKLQSCVAGSFQPDSSSNQGSGGSHDLRANQARDFPEPGPKNNREQGKMEPDDAKSFGDSIAVAEEQRNFIEPIQNRGAVVGEAVVSGPVFAAAKVEHVFPSQNLSDSSEPLSLVGTNPTPIDAKDDAAALIAPLSSELVPVQGTFPQDAASARAVLDEIRAMYHAGPEGSVQLTQSHRQLTRAISLLSGDLYAGQGHTLFELLQNSDDSQFGTLVDVGERGESNSFDCEEELGSFGDVGGAIPGPNRPVKMLKVDGVVPTVTVTLTQDRLVFSANEVGLSIENVQLFFFFFFC